MNSVLLRSLWFWLPCCVFGLLQAVVAEEPRSFSGIYPHLAMFNNEGECGTGAVVPWAGKLWVVTYSPHRPSGSDDKLYEITPGLQQVIRPESIGGTPANRMIHQESQQLFIGPYVVRESGEVRVIPYTKMFGRPTGSARHLFDPAGKIYCASMEEALYEIDVDSLEVTELWADESKQSGRRSNLPGYHGKGLSSGYGRVIYSNNGEHGQLAQSRPDIPSGALATWDGKADEWTVVLRTQFTEVTGPDGISGNLNPDRNPVWALGWDHLSLILMCLYDGEWQRYRLVKSSHAYDGAHGWNTEWPRIRDIGEEDLLMTMHGAFWKFPRTFQPGQTGGIRQRSSYLKIVADFCRWEDRIVLACDDSAKNEFLNTRKAKGKLAGPAQSQSNLWFLKPNQLDDFGPAEGSGAVWIDDAVERGTPSDPMHVGGFDQGSLFLRHDRKQPVEFVLEADSRGDGNWSELTRFQLSAGEGEWRSLPLENAPEWVRVVPQQASEKVTAHFDLRRLDSAPAADPVLFQSLAATGESDSRSGLVRAGDQPTGLQFLAMTTTSGAQEIAGYYELKPDLKLVRVEDAAKLEFMETEVALKPDVVSLAGNSVLYIDDDGMRYRLPIGNDWFSDHPDAINGQRIAREVCTERDLFQAAGTFYELPARNAGGFRKIRPVSTHDRWIHDYCSWRGTMVLTGLDAEVTDDPHVIRSEDGQAAVWLGTVDDLWKLGRPRGVGGPWQETHVEAGEVSDPYLLTGFGQKFLQATSSMPTRIHIECDILGTNEWSKMGELTFTERNGEQRATLTVADGSPPKTLPGDSDRFELPAAFHNAKWIRFRSENASTVSVTLYYE